MSLCPLFLYGDEQQEGAQTTPPGVPEHLPPGDNQIKLRKSKKIITVREMKAYFQLKQENRPDTVSDSSIQSQDYRKGNARQTCYKGRSEGEWHSECRL